MRPFLALLTLCSLPALAEEPEVRENHPPSVSSARVEPSVPVIGDELTCVPGEGTDPDGDTVSFRYQWYIDDVALTHRDQTIAPAVLEKDRRVSCVVTPIDGEDLGSPVPSAEVVVGNAPPVVASARVEPASPGTEDVVTCRWGEVTDPDGDRVTLSFAWTVDDRTVPGDADTLAPDDWKRGDTIRCVVTPNDGTARGAPVRSEPAVVNNASPVVASARVEPLHARAGDLLTCQVGETSDPDGEPVTTRVDWWLNGGVVAQGPTFRAPGRGAEVACLVTPNDGASDGRQVSSRSVRIRNTPPVVAAITLSPVTPRAGQPILAEPLAEDADGDDVVFDYTWTVDGVEVEGSANVLSDAFVRGQAVRVSVRPDDGEEVGEAVVSAEVVVANSPPSTPRVRVSDPRAGRRDAVCRVEVVDPDGDPLDLAFTWLRNGEPWAGASTTLHPGDTVPVAAMALDQDWTCAVTASDGLSTSAPSAPDTVTIVQAAVGAGSSHACALGTDGYVSCWGNWDYGLVEAPDERVRDLAVGGWHTCAIRQSDRSVACWGHDVYGQSRPPEGPFREIAAGSWHTCGIDLDGGVRCWGQDAEGRTAPPEGSFVALSAGWTHTCGIRTDGTLACWGGNDRGQSTPPPGRFVQVSAGESHTCALDAGGRAACWGSDRLGETAVPGGTFAMIQAGSGFTCGLRTDGRTTCWGADSLGQLEVPDVAFARIGRGVGTTCGWTRDHAVACWGNDRYGQATPPPP